MVQPSTARALTEASAAAGYSAAPARTVWVSSTGDDTQNGLSEKRAKATIGGAITALTALGGIGTIRLRKGDTLTLGAGDSFTLDTSSMNLVGEDSILQWNTAATAGYGLWFISTANYANQYVKWRPAMKGVTVRGSLNSPWAMDGVRVGQIDQTDLSGQVRFERGGIEGFATNLAVNLGAWRLSARSFNIRGKGAAIKQSITGVKSAGENMTFWDCLIEGAIDLSCGDWHFNGCSLDNAPLTARNIVVVWVNGGHLENPGDGTTGGYPYVTVVGGSAGVIINGTQFIVNAPTSGTFSSPIFVVDDAAATFGLQINNSEFPQQPYIHPEVSNGYRALVAGQGRVEVGHIQQNINGNGLPFARGLNLFRNGDGENATPITGWKTSGSAADSVITADTSTFVTGTQSLKIAPGNGTGKLLYQDVACRPGQLAMLSIARKFTAAAGGSVSIKGSWLDQNGAEISTWVFSSASATDTAWVYSGNSGVAPAGAVVCHFEMFVNGGTATGTYVNIDAAILNIV